MLESTGHLNNTALHSAAENAKVKPFLVTSICHSKVEVMRELIGNGLSLSSSNSRSVALCLNLLKNNFVFLFAEERAQCTLLQGHQGRTGISGKSH